MIKTRLGSDVSPLLERAVVRWLEVSVMSQVQLVKKIVSGRGAGTGECGRPGRQITRFSPTEIQVPTKLDISSFIRRPATTIAATTGR